jgi:hypothetical protein
MIKSRVGIFCVMAAITGAVMVAATPARADKRIALVMGNNDYKTVPSLKKAVNDSRTMGEALKSLGFQVMSAENQTRAGFADTLLAFDKMIEPGDTAFFFFAGHGFEIKGDNYLLPTDVPGASEGQEELVRDASVSAERIIDRVQQRGARTAVFVFDACRNNPFERQGTRALSGSGGLAAMSPPQGVFIVYSAGAKQTALDRLSDDDNSPNSVFTRNFTRELQEPGLNLVQIAKRTQVDVRDMASSIHHDQTPAYYDEVIGDVVLNGSPADSNRKIDVVDQRPTQLASLPPVQTAPNIVPTPEATNAPIASFSRHNGGWTVVFSLADPALVISWRVAGSSDFKDTGFLDSLDPRTRKRIPNPSIELDSDTPTETIEMRYVDANGDVQGPFPIKFDPTQALFRDQRKILDMTASSWVAFREFNGLLVYYTHLVTYRCAIKQMRIGVDTSIPDKVIQLPPCDMRDPSSVPGNAQVLFKVPPQTQSVSVELTYLDGSLSEIKTFKKSSSSIP